MAKGKGAKKTKGHTDNTEAGGADLSEITPKMKVDKYIDQYYDRQEKADQALLGYARIDIIKRNLQFGQYNKRLLDLKEKKALLDSFLSNGLDRYGRSNAISIIVKADDVIEETMKSESDLETTKRDGSHLPWLRFKWDPESESNESNEMGPEIIAAGGRHRRAALIDWIKAKKLRLNSAREHLKEIQEKERNEPGTVDTEEVREIEALVSHLYGLVVSGGSWIVAIYDESESLQLISKRDSLLSRQG